MDVQLEFRKTLIILFCLKYSQFSSTKKVSASFDEGGGGGRSLKIR